MALIKVIQKLTLEPFYYNLNQTMVSTTITKHKMSGAELANCLNNTTFVRWTGASGNTRATEYFFNNKGVISSGETNEWG